MPYALCCYFWMHSLCADCSFNYILPYNALRCYVAKRIVMRTLTQLSPCQQNSWHQEIYFIFSHPNNYRLITAYLLLRVNLDKIMHARWDFDASSAWTRRVSALDKHQNWSASALFCLNSRAQSKYAVVNLIHTRCKQTFLSFIMW